MRRIIIIYVLLIIAVIALALFRGGFFSFIAGKKTPTAEVDSHTFNLIEATTQKEQITGLSGRDSLDTNTGMIFIFQNKDKYPFWMKEMKFPLDIIYINDNKVVDDFENVPPQGNNNPATIPVYRPRDVANYVVEINGGLSKKYNIKIGDTVKLNNL